jgi:hypothetical protein
MKYVVIVTLLGCHLNCNAQVTLGADLVKVDSAFSYYFDVLDAYLAGTDLDHSVRRIQIISNLERLSHIEADGDGNYFGKMDFSRQNLIDWMGWHANNKMDLVWSNERNRIERRPIEKSIEYKFDKAVDVAIQSLIEKVKEKNGQVHIYIYMANSVSGNSCSSYKLFVESHSDVVPDYLSEIVNSSPRFYLYEQNPIPVLVDFDFDFMGNRAKINGELLRRSLKGSGNFIEFSRDGKWLKTSH